MIRTRAADEGNLTACPSADGLLLHTGLQGDDPASCFCSCGAPNPESCAVVVNLWGNVNCSGGANDSITLDPGCENANGQTVAGSVKWSSAPPQPGACAVSSDVDLSTPSWAAHMRVCNGETTTVEGEICLATEAGFDAQACVVKEGSVACPAGYPEQRVGFLDFEEGRGCSECTCDTSTASCGGHVTVQTTGLCGSGTAGAVIGPNSCSQLVNAAALTAIAYDPATSGTCAVGGGQPTGLVDKVGAHTVCCTP